MNIEEAIEYLKLKMKNDNLTIQGMFGDIYEEIQKDNKAIEILLTAYEKEKGERERIGKLYYEANENCIKYEKMIKKEKEKNKELRNQLNTIKDIYYNTNDLEELSDVLGGLLSNLKEE